MENALHALEMNVGVILLCIGISLAIYMGDLLNKEMESVSKNIYENHMIRRE